jgi:hypothetical protein
MLGVDREGPTMRSILTRLAIAVTATAAAVAARRAATAGWRQTTGDEPPSANPFSDDADVRTAALWAGLLGTSVWVAKRLAARGTEAVLAPSD